MYPDIATKLAALLPKLIKVKNRLRRTLSEHDNCYCLEGALCELYRLETGEGQWANDHDGTGWVFLYKGYSYRTFMPLELEIWAGKEIGVNSALLTVNYEGGNWALLSLNDGTELTFDEIANMLMDQFSSRENSTQSGETINEQDR